MILGVTQNRFPAQTTCVISVVEAFVKFKVLVNGIQSVENVSLNPSELFDAFWGREFPKFPKLFKREI